MSRHNDGEYRSYQITSPDNEHLSVTELSPEAALNSAIANASDTNRDNWQVQTVEVDANFHVVFVNAQVGA